MAKRQNILVQWTIGEGCWREFMAASRSRQKPGSFVPIDPGQPFPAFGIDVAIREDAVYVGKKCHFLYCLQSMRWMVVHESWLEITHIINEGSNHVSMIPIAREAIRDVKRVVDEFDAQDAEAMRIQKENDDRPTFINGLRRWVEAHTLITIIGFFVVVLPLFVFAMAVLFLE